MPATTIWWSPAAWRACRRVGIGASGGAWPVDPQVALPSYFMPQGVSADLIATKYGFSRDDCDAYAVESQKRDGKAWDDGPLRKIGRPGQGHQRHHHSRQGRTSAPDTDMQSLAALNASFELMGQMGGFDAVAHSGASGTGSGQARPPCRQFVGHRRRRRRRADRQQARRPGRRADAAGERSAPSPISAPIRR